MLVGTVTPVVVEAGTFLIQNLGPGDLYLSNVEANLGDDEGLVLGVGVGFEAPQKVYGRVYLLASEADTDVRVLKL